MRFEPNLIDSEDVLLDADGDLVLDQALVDVASQLRREADELAEHFPARVQPAIAEEAMPRADNNEPKRFGSTTAFGVIAIGLISLASCVVLTFTVDSWWRSSSEVSHSSPTVTQSLSASVAGDKKSNATDRATPIDVRAIDAEDSADPVRFMPIVSGPELEAVLDLLEDGNASEPSIAI